MNTVPLGELAARAMEDLGNDFDLDAAAVVACGLVVIVDNGEGREFTRTYSSRELYFEKFGLFTVALDCVTNGESLEMNEDVEADEEE